MVGGVAWSTSGTAPLRPDGEHQRVGRTPSWRVVGDLIPGLLFVCGLALYSVRLGIPDRYIYDEVYHAYTAAEYVRGNPDAYLWDTQAPREGVAYMWNHPPVGVLLIASGIAIWGDTSFGWRFASAVFGAAGLVLAYALALRLTRRRGVALLAAGLLLVDGLYFVQSRTGMLDVFGTFFMLAAFLAFHRYLTTPVGREGPWLAATGVGLGLAIATKWSAAYPSACIGLVAVARGLGALRTEPTLAVGPPRPAGWARSLGWIALGLGVIPAAIYLMSYIPFFAMGHSVDQFVELQRQILYYHSHLKESHTYQSRWWQWPLALRPVWYHVAYLGDRIANVYANSNPVLSVAFVPAAIAMVIGWGRRRDPAALVLLAGFFGQWLPWALVPRIAFGYHFLPATPFGCIAVAAVLGLLWGRGTPGRAACVIYVAAAVGAFAFLYPIYASVLLTRHELDLRMWLPSWR